MPTRPSAPPPSCSCAGSNGISTLGRAHLGLRDLPNRLSITGAHPRIWELAGWPTWLLTPSCLSTHPTQQRVHPKDMDLPQPPTHVHNHITTLSRLSPSNTFDLSSSRVLLRLFNWRLGLPVSHLAGRLTELGSSPRPPIETLALVSGPRKHGDSGIGTWEPSSKHWLDFDSSTRNMALDSGSADDVV